MALIVRLRRAFLPARLPFVTTERATLLPLSPLTAISPLDGRYEPTARVLRAVFSEFAFMRARVRVEIE